MSSIRVLSVASEIYPIIKTGGLADVAGALPLALKARGNRDAHARARISRRHRARSKRLKKFLICRIFTAGRLAY